MQGTSKHCIKAPAYQAAIGSPCVTRLNPKFIGLDAALANPIKVRRANEAASSVGCNVCDWELNASDTTPGFYIDVG